MLKLNAYKFNFKMDAPITISFHTWHYSENVIVTLSYKNFTGLGEGAPFQPITGDTQDQILKKTKQIGELNLDPKKNSLEDLHKLLDKKIPHYQTLKAAVDFAYHDLLGKIDNKPAYKLYSKKPVLKDNSVTVFIQESPEETAKKAQEIYKKYPHLKLLKIKLKGQGDIERVKAIKKVSPAKMSFILDANQGFKDPKVAVKTLLEIGDILGKVILVEEPCPKGQLKKLKYVKDNLKGILVFADESAATLEDAKKVVKHQAAHGINIKLQKAGGIYPSKQIAKLCQDNGLKVMVGCMLEGPISISAGVHFAVSTDNVILTDLDMDLDLPTHTKETLAFKKGSRIPSKKPGLGIEFDLKKLENLKKKGELIYDKISVLSND